MIWSILIIGIFLITFAIIMFRRLLLDDDMSVITFVLFVIFPGLFGGLMIGSFWVLLLAKAIGKL